MGTSEFGDIGFCNTEQYIEGNIINCNENIVELIEEGDYVNGILVTGKEGSLLYTKIKGIDGSGYHIPISQYGENIKTILTKEKYESNCYKLEK